MVSWKKTRCTPIQAVGSAIAETEIVRAHESLNNLARSLEESPTTGVHTIGLVIAAGEMRRVTVGRG
jgi:hypothetical protein